MIATTSPDKVANIVSRPIACSDDGRALGLQWILFLNDYGGRGFWHGGPNHPNHGSVHGSEDEAKARAEELGYTVTGTTWQ